MIDDPIASARQPFPTEPGAAPGSLEGPASPRSCDVLVIGGGPGGSTAAALLAQRGWRVTLLEKEQHPRFHIGESLLPMNMPILERLGVLDEVARIGILKEGADFTCTQESSDYHTFLFARAFDKRHPTAYEVRRSEFDELLLRNSARLGAQVLERVRVEEVAFQPQGGAAVRAVDADGRRLDWQARFVVDASGRDTFLGRAIGLKRKNPRHSSAAIFAHFRNGERRPGRNAGNISIYQFAQGWMWMIPLRDNVMSVGCVCWPEYMKQRTGSLEEFFKQTIASCPEAASRLRQAELTGEVRATGNYSYTSSRMAGRDYVLVGDAFAFVDPIFSSGVYLAMNSACHAVDAVDASLRDPQAATAVMQRFDRQVRRGLGMFSWFIYRFTTPAMRHLFAHPRNLFRMEEAVTSLLAGDVFRRSEVLLRLRLFQLIYFISSVARTREGLRWRRRRHRNLQVVFSGGTTAQDRNV